MIYYLTDVILANWRQRVTWSVRQNGEILAKGESSRDISTVCQIIKDTKIHIPTDEEIAEKKRIAQEKYERRKKRIINKVIKDKKEKAPELKEVSSSKLGTF